ncbi:hypothetical protein AAC387_Pa04g1211 [Persea americana]
MSHSTLQGILISLLLKMKKVASDVILDLSSMINQTLKLRPGLRQDGDAISVMKAGRLRFSKPNKYWVESSEKRFKSESYVRYVELQYTILANVPVSAYAQPAFFALLPSVFVSDFNPLSARPAAGVLSASMLGGVLPSLLLELFSVFLVVGAVWFCSWVGFLSWDVLCFSKFSLVLV